MSGCCLFAGHEVCLQKGFIHNCQCKPSRSKGCTSTSWIGSIVRRFSHPASRLSPAQVASRFVSESQLQCDSVQGVASIHFVLRSVISVGSYNGLCLAYPDCQSLCLSATIQRIGGCSCVVSLTKLPTSCAYMCALQGLLQKMCLGQPLQESQVLPSSSMCSGCIVTAVMKAPPFIYCNLSC